MKARVIFRDASVREGPGVSFESIGTIPVETIVEYSTVVQEIAGEREWLRLSTGVFTGKYLNALYPDSTGQPIARVEFLNGDEPTPVQAKINFAVVNYTDETGTHEVTLYPE